jgi:hypothetical protein
MALARLRSQEPLEPMSAAPRRAVATLAEPEPSFYKRYTTGGPELDIMRYYQGAWFTWGSCVQRVMGIA